MSCAYCADESTIYLRFDCPGCDIRMVARLPDKDRKAALETDKKRITAESGKDAADAHEAAVEAKRVQLVREGKW